MEKGDNSSAELEDTKLGKDYKSTVPKAVRALIGIEPGDTLTWTYDKNLDGAWVRKKED